MPSIHSSSTPSSLQGAHQASHVRTPYNMLHETGMRFTIQLHDYQSAKKIFDELARSKDIGVKQQSDIYDLNDFGGGFGMYNTLHFSFKPDSRDGSFSLALQMRISDFHREFQQKLDEAGIRNYAPSE
jgi:hypothetical protein